MKLINDNLWRAYQHAGFHEKAYDYIKKALVLDDDSVSYYWRSGTGYYLQYEDPEGSIDIYNKGYKKDSNNAEILRQLGYKYTLIGQYETALKYLEKYFETVPSALGEKALIGYVYKKLGYIEKSESYFSDLIYSCDRRIQKDIETPNTFPRYFLAAVYATKGEKDSAYRNLAIFNQRQVMPNWIVLRFKVDPLFENIRNEPEFKKIAREVEEKYLREHERVRKWLEENEML